MSVFSSRMIFRRELGCFIPVKQLGVEAAVQLRSPFLTRLLKPPHRQCHRKYANLCLMSFASLLDVAVPCLLLGGVNLAMDWAALSVLSVNMRLCGVSVRLWVWLSVCLWVCLASLRVGCVWVWLSVCRRACRWRVCVLGASQRRERRLTVGQIKFDEI